MKKALALILCMLFVMGLLVIGCQKAEEQVAPAGEQPAPAEEAPAGGYGPGETGGYGPGETGGYGAGETGGYGQ